MKRLLTIIAIITTLLIGTGCQANLITQSNANTTVSNIAYHNQFVEHINAIIATAEKTIGNDKQSQLAEISTDQLNQDLQILIDQVNTSTTTLNQLTPVTPVKNNAYQETFTNDYLKTINNYIQAYTNWLTNIQNTPQSSELEQMYSKFIQSHNYFVEIINGQV